MWFIFIRTGAIENDISFCLQFYHSVFKGELRVSHIMAVSTHRHTKAPAALPPYLPHKLTGPPEGCPTAILQILNYYYYYYLSLHSSKRSSLYCKFLFRIRREKDQTTVSCLWSFLFLCFLVFTGLVSQTNVSCIFQRKYWIPNS